MLFPGPVVLPSLFVEASTHRCRGHDGTVYVHVYAPPARCRTGAGREEQLTPRRRGERRDGRVAVVVVADGTIAALGDPDEALNVTVYVPASTR